MGQLRLGRAVVTMGSFAVPLTRGEAGGGQPAFLEVSRTGHSEPPVSGSTDSVQTAIWNVLCENTWGAPPLSTSDFHKQRSQKKKVL